MSGVLSADIEEVILRINMEALCANQRMLGIVRGVAAVLGLDERRLVRHAAWLADACVMYGECARDMEMAVDDAVERIGGILADGDAWDAYSASQAPSAYRYAAAVAVWLYLHAAYLGAYIPAGHPLFSDDAAAAVARFLASRAAGPTIAEAVRRALRALERARRTAHPLRG
jgi:hypothetical protein